MSTAVRLLQILRDLALPTSSHVVAPLTAHAQFSPQNHTLFEDEHPETATISVAFNPSLRVDNRLPDTILVSSNHVYFYAHRHRLIGSSYNAFNGRLGDHTPFARGTLPRIRLPDGGDILNVVIHTAYNLPCTHFFPAFETVEAALAALGTYGVPLNTLADPTLSPGPILGGTPDIPHFPLSLVDQLVLSHAPYRPIDTYALAAQHGLDAVAVVTSGHLLSFDLSTVTDELAHKMGPVYLKRLFLLHQNRLAALRNILLRAPDQAPHVDGQEDWCDGQTMVREWAIVTAGLVWDATPS